MPVPQLPDIIARLKPYEAELRAQGVQGLFIFGSVARGEAHDNSDIDLFFDDAPRMGMKFFDVQDRLAELLPVRADVTTRGGLHKLARARIEREAVQVF